MKLVQLNTWSCKLPTEIVRLFQKEAPDVVCLQEVVTGIDGGKIFDTIQAITNKYSFEYEYNTPLVEFNFMHKSATRGNMIAANWKFLDTQQVWTLGQFTRNFDYTHSGGYNVARNIAHAIVETPQGSCHVLTLHGYHMKEHKNGNDETLRACRELVEYSTSLDGPVIITGDFNLSPTSESIQLVNRAFRNLTTEYNLTTTRNHLTEKTEVCDYIFVNDKVNVKQFYMSDIIASDHNALVLDFDL